ncbi:sentrin-specific protease 2 isoform X2 [Drosophila grimshawi]|uniref:GH12462 n=1 Tax=Drosophila grimshawi TaxID=7222 RepID=B4JJC3_DROGR|nr:sentrin-specific protease 2 isoform X2 [Drosophila grimshawi]EDV99675.1 GH12462 [Drosophila grimshawi]
MTIESGSGSGAGPHLPIGEPNSSFEANTLTHESYQFPADALHQQQPNDFPIYYQPAGTEQQLEQQNVPFIATTAEEVPAEQAASVDPLDKRLAVIQRTVDFIDEIFRNRQKDNLWSALVLQRKLVEVRNYFQSEKQLNTSETAHSDSTALLKSIDQRLAGLVPNIDSVNRFIDVNHDPMGFDLFNKLRHWFLGGQSNAKDPANIDGERGEIAAKLKRSYQTLNKETTSPCIFKYRRVDDTFPEFMPNDADDYGHMANPRQHQENNSNQTQKRLSIFSAPQSRHMRVRNTQIPVSIDLPDTEEQHHNESKMYQAFADRLGENTVSPSRNDFGCGTSAARPNLLYSDAVRFGTNGFKADLNYPRPSSSSSSSDARLNGHAGNMYAKGIIRNSVIRLEEQRHEHNQYINLINNLFLHDRERSLTRRPITSRDSEKPQPLASLQRISPHDDEWRRDLKQGKLQPHASITSERAQYAKLLEREEQKQKLYPLIKKPLTHEFVQCAHITDQTIPSDVSKSMGKDFDQNGLRETSTQMMLPNLSRTKAVQQRHSNSIYFADNYAELFKEKCDLVNQETNHAKKLVLQEANKVTEERRASEQELRESLTKRRFLTQTLFVLEKQPEYGAEDNMPEIIPLTDDHQKQYNELIYGKPDKVLISKFSLSIKREDIRTLTGSCWLNDEVINFYMNLLTDRSQRKDTLPSVYAMNTFFVPRLLQGYSNVRRWTRKVDIFSKDIIPVPVHVSNVHWCMAIIHMKNKTIHFYDSMGKPNWEVLNALERYLQEESLDKRKKPFDTSDFLIENVKDVPHQTNGSDCGVFSCMTAEYITRNKPLTFSQENMEYFRKKMVLEICGGELWM